MTPATGIPQGQDCSSKSHQRSASDRAGKVNWTQSRTVRAIAVGVGLLVAGAAVACLAVGFYGAAIAAGAVAVFGGLAAAGYFYAHRHDTPAQVQKSKSAGSYPVRPMSVNPDYGNLGEAGNKSSVGDKPVNKPKSIDVKQQRTLLSTDQVYNQLQAINSDSNPQYDHELTDAVCCHRDRDNYGEALVRLGQDLAGLKQALGPDHPDIKFQEACNKVVSQYRFGQKSYRAAYELLCQQYPERKRQIEQILQASQPVKKNMLTINEFRELQLYRKAVDIFYDNQHQGNSNCQSFVNVLEHFFRGLGYQQVIGVREQLSVGQNAGTAPVACWNLKGYRDKCITAFIHKVSSFNQAVVNGQQDSAGENEDTTEKLNGSRYILLKTCTQGGAGHYLTMVRSRATGRFIVIDGQNRKVYPLTHPDGSFTDEGKEFENTNVHAYRMDTIPDETFSAEFKKSNDLMRGALNRPYNL